MLITCQALYLVFYIDYDILMPTQFTKTLYYPPFSERKKPGPREVKQFDLGQTISIRARFKPMSY